ncbi:MAG: hypothetical protein RR107_01395 [Clostridia bacterium]
MEYQTRKEVRLQDYDYSQNGAYFVTICANNRCENLAYVGNILKTIPNSGN